MTDDDALLNLQHDNDMEKAATTRRFLGLVGGRGIGCWLWKGTTNKHGYAGFKFGSKMVKSHRFVYELLHGHQGDAEIHHDCLNPSCVRPSHLKAISKPKHRNETRKVQLSFNRDGIK